MTLDEAQIEIQTAMAKMQDQLTTCFDKLDGGDEIKVVNREQFEAVALALMELSYYNGRLAGLNSATTIMQETFLDVVMSQKPETE